MTVRRREFKVGAMSQAARRRGRWGKGLRRSGGGEVGSKSARSRRQPDDLGAAREGLWRWTLPSGTVAEPGPAGEVGAALSGGCKGRAAAMSRHAWARNQKRARLLDCFGTEGGVTVGDRGRRMGSEFRPGGF